MSLFNLVLQTNNDVDDNEIISTFIYTFNSE